MAVVTAVIMVGVVVVAVGRGGEMAFFTSDYAPLELGAVAATDVVLLRPPTSIWGYNIQVTDEALGRITHALSQRDIRIASLEQQVADLRATTQPGLGADLPAVRWEARAAGWESVPGNAGRGVTGFTNREPVPATRPQPGPGTEGGAGAGHSAPSPGGADPAGADPGGADPGGADPPGADPPGADPPGADPAGADPAGADPAGPAAPVDAPDGGAEPGGAAEPEPEAESEAQAADPRGRPDDPAGQNGGGGTGSGPQRVSRAGPGTSAGQGEAQ
jgi:hypothetical protein